MRPPRPLRPPRPPHRPWRPGRGGGGGGPWPYGYATDYTYMPVIQYTSPVTCYDEQDRGKLPPCFGRLMRDSNGRWCCVEDVSSF